MFWSYDYTPYLWVVLAFLALSTVLMIQGIRCRFAPGAISFVVLLGAVMLWMSARVLSIASTDEGVRILWFKFQASLILPSVTAAMCFAIEYAGLGRFLGRRILVVLGVVPLAFIFMILTNHVHHLVWTRIWLYDYVRSDNGPASDWAAAYVYFLSLLHLLVLIWLFIHSPRHRAIVVFLMISLMSTRIAFISEAMHWNSTIRVDLMIVVVTLAILPYAVAIFRFRMFDVVLVARNVIIERMEDAIIVVDSDNRIVDLNRASHEILGLTGSRWIGCNLADAVPSSPWRLKLIQASEKGRNEVCLPNNRCYQVSISPLVDERQVVLGRIILLHDITELKQAEMQLLDNQQKLTILKERELLARELHDGIGQVLAAAQLQITSAQELLARGDSASVETCLRCASDATQEAKKSIREYLLGVKARSSSQQSLVSVLRHYLTQYRDTYGIRTELVVPPELEDQPIDPVVESQLQPIIQEALTNARRHGRAQSARVVFGRFDGQLSVTIEDDGCGWDPGIVAAEQGFGLRSMHGRAEAIGGVLEVSSEPGKGTRVSIQVPCRRKEA
ncbi:MAG: PAS domain-containing protein [Sedimentisphaerales bacterium]|nr:PAS domain-containing protein [Sedimentisphaerales bacterium]